MRICENGSYRDMTAEELAAIEAARSETPETTSEEPTELDRFAAQLTYTAVMTDTLINGEV